VVGSSQLSIEISHFSIVMRGFSIEISLISIVISLISIVLRHFSIEISRGTIKISHFLIVLRHFSIEISHFSIVLRHFSIEILLILIVISPFSIDMRLRTIEIPSAIMADPSCLGERVVSRAWCWFWGDGLGSLGHLVRGIGAVIGGPLVSWQEAPGKARPHLNHGRRTVLGIRLPSTDRHPSAHSARLLDRACRSRGFSHIWPCSEPSSLSLLA
jgi:hypothetical protein